MSESDNTLPERRSLPRKSFEELVALNPFAGDPAFRAEVEEALANRKKGVEHRQKARTATPDEAFRLLWLSWCLNPHHIVTLSSLARIYMMRGESKKALTLLMACLEVGPNDVIALTMAARVLTDMERLPEALACAKKALTMEQSAATHYTLGHVYRELYDQPNARIQYRKSIALDPGMIRTHRELASIEMRDGNYAQALKSIDTALRFEPKHRYSLKLKIIILYKYKRPSEAADVLETFAQLYPLDESILSMRPHIYLLAGNSRLAAQYADERLRKDPRDTYLLVAAGLAALRMNEAPRALAYLTNPALDNLEPGLWLRARAQAQVGKVEDAIKSIMQILHIMDQRTRRWSYVHALLALAPEGHPAHEAMKKVLTPKEYEMALMNSKSFNWTKVDSAAEQEFSENVSNSFNTLLHDRPINRAAVREVKGGSRGKK